MPWLDQPANCLLLQIFPINVKGVAGSLATLVNWFGAWAVSYTFNFLMAWSSYGKHTIVTTFSPLRVKTSLYIIIWKGLKNHKQNIVKESLVKNSGLQAEAINLSRKLNTLLFGFRHFCALCCS